MTYWGSAVFVKRRATPIVPVVNQQRRGRLQVLLTRAFSEAIIKHGTGSGTWTETPGKFLIDMQNKESRETTLTALLIVVCANEFTQ
jgi:hypothetical protein